MFDIERLEELKRETDEAFKNPQVGDCLHERYAFWVYVIAVDDEVITTCETSNGWQKTYRTQTKAEFTNRFAYGSISGYWVMLLDRGNDVSRLLDESIGGENG